MLFKTTGKETLGWNMKKQKLLGAIAMNNLEIKKFRTNSAFPVYILTIMMNSSHLMYF